MSSPQQILHVVAELDGYGLTRQLELLVEQQMAAGQRVRVVALAADRDATSRFDRLGTGCRVLNRRWRHDPIAAVRLAGELRRQTADILHLWGQPALDTYRSIRRFIHSTPALTSLPAHTLWSLPAHTLWSLPAHTLWSLPEHTLWSLPEQTLLNSQRSNSILPGIAPPHISNLSRQQFLADQLLPKDAILIAVAGPLTRPQRIDEAIWYFELVRTLDERVRLLIFGDGPEKHRFERFSRLASEPSAIRFLGYRTDFRELLRHANLFWQTGAPDEALPLTVLEAMAAGVPVVANDGPSSRQIISDGDNGYVVPDKNRAAFARQTLRLIQDDRHAKKIGGSAAQWVTERFSVEAMSRAYADLYNQLLSG